MSRATLSTIAAAALAAALPANSQDMTNGTGSGVITTEQRNRAISADEALEADVYSMNQTYDENTWLDTNYWNSIDAEWAEIGEVEDLLMSRDGQVIGLVVETGGWLDIGDDEYVIDLQDVRVVDDGMGVINFVTRLSQDEIEQMPEADQETWF